MNQYAIAAVALAAGLAMTPNERTSPDPLHTAAKALAVDAVRTVRLTGTGATYTVGQNFSPTDPWPRVGLTHYEMLVNYATETMRQDFTREMGSAMPRGGGVPFTGVERQIETVSGEYAWDEPVPADPSVGSLPTTTCTPPELGGTAPVPAAAPQSRIPCMLMLWSTPHGFVKAALANHASQRSVDGGTEVSFSLDGKYRMTGRLNARGDVERVATWVEQSIVGDMKVETVYGGYRDFDGIRFPATIRQEQDGFPSLELTVTSVKANVPVDVEVPRAVRDAAPQAIEVKPVRVADGVYWLTGGTHHSLAVSMKDYVVLVDAPNGEQRASAVLAKTKELFPEKTIRYVVAMHHHWDHMGGIRTAIDEGATIVTHETNKSLLERAATAPFTIAPDRLSKSRRPLKIETVGARKTISDGERELELYTMTGFDHADDMLLVYLPKERVLAEADAYSPPATPTTPLIAPKVSYAAALYDNVRRLHLDVRQVVPFHGNRIVDMDEVRRQGGR